MSRNRWAGLEALATATVGPQAPAPRKPRRERTDTRGFVATEIDIKAGKFTGRKEVYGATSYADAAAKVLAYRSRNAAPGAWQILNSGRTVWNDSSEIGWNISEEKE